MSGKRYFGFADFAVWVRNQVSGVTDLLNTKLGSEDTAVNSHRLEGRTKAQVMDDTKTYMALGTAAKADIFVSTVDPLPGDGKDGDLWIKYTP